MLKSEKYNVDSNWQSSSNPPAMINMININISLRTHLFLYSYIDTI